MKRVDQEPTMSEPKKTKYDRQLRYTLSPPTLTSPLYHQFGIFFFRDCDYWEKKLCRIWGEQGQTALENASICLLNCGPTGSETLKNLVLGGIGSITIVDGSKVEIGDLGNNFMGMIVFLVLFCSVIFVLLGTYFWKFGDCFDGYISG